MFKCLKLFKLVIYIYIYIYSLHYNLYYGKLCLNYILSQSIFNKDTLHVLFTHFNSMIAQNEIKLL